nr:hypothetical protein [Tanacetum cinerariifolium]
MRDKSTCVQNDIHVTKEGTHATHAVGTGMKESFASIFKTQFVSKAGRLTTMTSEFVQGANVAIPLADAEEVSSLAALKESFVVAIPFSNRTRHSLETVEVETRFWIRMTPPHVKTSCLNVVAKDSLKDVLDDDDEQVEEVYIKDNVRHAKQNKGASTLSDQVQDV